MQVWIGIDPGAKGAICVLGSDGSTSFLDLSDPPHLIMGYLRGIQIGDEIQATYIEEVHSLYGMSAKSNFSFGWNVGVVHTIADCIHLPIQTVQPKVWQQTVGVTSKGKEIKQNVADLCDALYPNASIRGAKGGLRDGRSDALMIAHYAYERSKSECNSN